MARAVVGPGGQEAGGGRRGLDTRRSTLPVYEEPLGDFARISGRLLTALPYQRRISSGRIGFEALEKGLNPKARTISRRGLRAWAEKDDGR
jgi:hypothetical protein